jgi:hypothetical protein
MYTQYQRFLLLTNKNGDRKFDIADFDKLKLWLHSHFSELVYGFHGPF